MNIFVVGQSSIVIAGPPAGIPRARPCQKGIATRRSTIRRPRRAWPVGSGDRRGGVPSAGLSARGATARSRAPNRRPLRSRASWRPSSASVPPISPARAASSIARPRPRMSSRMCCSGSSPTRRESMTAPRPPMSGGWCATSPSTGSGDAASSGACSWISRPPPMPPIPGWGPPRSPRPRGNPCARSRTRWPNCRSRCVPHSGCTGSRGCRRSRSRRGSGCHAPWCAASCAGGTCTASRPSTGAAPPARRAAARQASISARPSPSARNSAATRLASTPG